MSEYKNRLLELAESLRLCDQFEWEDCKESIEHSERVDELIDMINHLEVVEYDRLTEPE